MFWHQNKKRYMQGTPGMNQVQMLKNNGFLENAPVISVNINLGTILKSLQ